MCLTVSELYGSEVHSGVLYAISRVGAAITKLLCASLLVNYMDQKYTVEFFMHYHNSCDFFSTGVYL